MIIGVSTKSLYHGLWTRKMLTRDRFKAIMAMLHIVDFSKESKEDKLKKVRHFIDHMCQRCRKLYQPSANVAIDERMVKSKHRSGMRQYMPLKPVKFGLKLWVLAYSLNGYTYDFDIYTGKGEPLHEQGLGYGRGYSAGKKFTGEINPDVILLVKIKFYRQNKSRSYSAGKT